MRGGPGATMVEDMDRPRTAPHRRWGVTAALALALVVAGLTVTVGYGFATEYADASARPLEAAWWTVRSWSLGIVLAATVAFGAALSVRSRAVTVVAVVLVGGTVVTLGVAGVLGATAKYDRYPVVPDCIGEFDAGPALRVVRAAQRAFEELDHPAPFSGGGRSGGDGCSSELMVRDEESPVPGYRAGLSANGWDVVTDTGPLVRAKRDGEAFELFRGEGGAWTVWIGPSRLGERAAGDGQVKLRP
jgi:hypothetical protein